MSRARAAQLVAAARRVGELPQVAKRFRAGEMSVDQATAVLRRAPVAHDERMAELAPMLSMGQLRQVLAALPPLPSPPSDTEPEPEPAPAPREPRRLSGHFTEDGNYALRGQVPGDCGALWERAMAAARTDLFDRQVAGIDSVSALERILNLALDGLDPASARGERPGERYQVMIHLDRRDDGPLDRVQPHLGPWLPSGLSRYLCCDASVRLALYDSDGKGTSRLVGFSPQARVVDAKTRAAIEHRDRGCRVPGCEQRGWLHIHHIRHWADGETTVPSNLVALCPHHHRLHHLGLLGIGGDPERLDGLVVTDQRGHPVGASPPRPPRLGLIDTAEDLHVPPGSTWAHPWGEPLDRNSYAWN